MGVYGRWPCNLFARFEAPIEGCRRCENVSATALEESFEPSCPRGLTSNLRGRPNKYIPTGELSTVAFKFKRLVSMTDKIFTPINIL